MLADYGTILFAVLLSCVQFDVNEVPNRLCLKVCFGLKNGSYASLGIRKHEESQGKN